MHLLKHILTEAEKDHLRSYLEMINSKDIESNMLAVSMFFNEFKNYKCPTVIRGKFILVKLRFPNSMIYWYNRIESLLFYEFYCY